MSSSNKQGFLPTPWLVIAIFLAAFAPSETLAFCCNGFTTQSCANCNFFWCNCDNPCDCKNSCETNCSQEQTQCIIYCTQGNCSYCDGYYHACINRCNSASASSLDIDKKPRKKQIAKASSECPIYQAMDANKNGAVSRNEFIDFIDSQRKTDWPTTNEMTPMQTALRLIAGQNPAEVFDRYDTNHDGSIDHKEAGLPSKSRHRRSHSR